MQIDIHIAKTEKPVLAFARQYVGAALAVIIKSINCHRGMENTEDVNNKKISVTSMPLWQILSFISFCFFITSCAVQQTNKIWDPLQQNQTTDTGIKRSTKNMSPAIAALIKQADLKIEQKQWSSSISIIERALRINPKQAEAWTRMAVAHLGNNNAEQAIHMAKRANAYTGKNSKLKSYNWLLMSRAYKILNKLDAAKSAALKSQKIMQENN